MDTDEQSLNGRMSLNYSRERKKQERFRHSSPRLLIILTVMEAAISAAFALPAQHSKAFPLRYECDVAPALAGWTLVPGSSVSAGQSTNGWLSFVTSASQISNYQNSQWNVVSNQAYTVEIRFRTPRQGQIRLEVNDGGVNLDALSVSATGLVWSVNGVDTWIAANTSNAMHVIRVASWSDQGLRWVQVWQDGRSIHGPTMHPTISSNPGPAIQWGDPSNTEPADIEIDYLRMVIGGAFEPFLSRLEIESQPGTIGLIWSTAPQAVYQLQSAPVLAGSAWSDLGGEVPAMTSNGSFIDSMAGKPSGFYRVQEIVEGSILQAWTPGVPPVCANLPPFNCVAGCTDLVPFEPVLGPGYENFPVNGETPVDQYRSYVQREVRQAVQFAAAKVACQAGHWPFGNNRPIGLGDMSEANGAVPGTRDGNPSHPAGTHTDGLDIDVAYYQLDTINNNLRAICEHRVGGVDQFHCVAAPNILDLWRTALFVGILLEHPRLRVIGVDGQVGPLLLAAIGQLSAAGWLATNVPVTAQQKLAFETSDQGMGWFSFHHQYMHISFAP